LADVDGVYKFLVGKRKEGHVNALKLIEIRR